MPFGERRTKEGQTGATDYVSYSRQTQKGKRGGDNSQQIKGKLAMQNERYTTALPSPARRELHEKHTNRRREGERSAEGIREKKDVNNSTHHGTPKVQKQLGQPQCASETQKERQMKAAMKMTKEREH